MVVFVCGKLVEIVCASVHRYAPNTRNVHCAIAKAGELTIAQNCSHIRVVRRKKIIEGNWYSDAITSAMLIETAKALALAAVTIISTKILLQRQGHDDDNSYDSVDDDNGWALTVSIEWNLIVNSTVCLCMFSMCVQCRMYNVHVCFIFYFYMYLSRTHIPMNYANWFFMAAWLVGWLAGWSIVVTERTSICIKRYIW